MTDDNAQMRTAINSSQESTSTFYLVVMISIFGLYGLGIIDTFRHALGVMGVVSVMIISVQYILETAIKRKYRSKNETL